MKRFYLQLKKAILFLGIVFIYSLVFIGNAGAPPGPPPPPPSGGPSVPAGSEWTYALVAIAVGGYGMWKTWKRK